MSKNRQLAQFLICTVLAACASQPQKSPAPARQSEPRVLTVTPAIARQVRDAQAAMQTGNYPDGIAKAQALESMHDLTPYEVHVINELLGYGFAHDGELPRAADYLERGFADGFLAATQRQQRVNALATLNYQLKNFAKAVSFGTLAAREGFADEKTYVLVSQAYYLQGDYRAAATFTGDRVQAVIARHEVPSESSLQVILSSCAKLQDRGCEVHALEKLVTYHSTPQYQIQLDGLRHRSP